MRALKSRLPLGSSLASLASRAHADAPLPLALLRVRRERPRCRAAEKRNERAPPHGASSRDSGRAEAITFKATPASCHKRSLASSAAYFRLLGNSLKQTDSNRLTSLFSD